MVAWTLDVQFVSSVFVWHELWLVWRMWWVGDEGVRVRWWMVRGCGKCEGGCSEWRLRCWARACVYGRVCGMIMCGLLVCECVRMVWGGVACGKGVCGVAHVGVHCIGTVWL